VAIRIKSTWHDSGRNESNAKSMADNGAVLAFIVWRLSVENAKELHREGFDYNSDRERVGMISEFCAFCLQVADRMAYAQLSDPERQELVSALALRLADQIQDNLTEIAGRGAYRRAVIDLLNRRMGEYAQCSYEGEPGFDFYRQLGKGALEVMGETQTNRWVMDQVMEIVGPELVEQLKKSVGNLLR